MNNREKAVKYYLGSQNITWGLMDWIENQPWADDQDIDPEILLLVTILDDIEMRAKNGNKYSDKALRRMAVDRYFFQDRRTPDMIEFINTGKVKDILDKDIVDFYRFLTEPDYT